jgi:hypothetical protein
MIAAVLLSLASRPAVGQSQPASQAGNVIAASTNATPAPAAGTSLPGQSRMNQFEDDLFGTHQPIDLSREVESATASPERPLPRLAPLDSEARERLEKSRDWAFSIMNDLDSQPSVERMMNMPEYGPDGRPKQRLSPVQEFWENTGRDKSTNSDSMMNVLGMEWDARQLSSTNGFNPLITTMSGGDKMMKSVLMLEELNDSTGNPGIGGNAADSTAEGIKAAATATAADAAADRNRKHRQEVFDSLLGGAPAAIAGPSFSMNGQNNNFPGPPQVYSPAAAGSFSPLPVPMAAPANPTSLSPVMGAYNSLPTGLPSPAAAANPASMENLRNLLNPEPKATANEPADPYVQNFPKRKF